MVVRTIVGILAITSLFIPSYSHSFIFPHSIIVSGSKGFNNGENSLLGKVLLYNTESWESASFPISSSTLLQNYSYSLNGNLSWNTINNSAFGIDISHNVENFYFLEVLDSFSIGGYFYNLGFFISKFAKLHSVENWFVYVNGGAGLSFITLDGTIRSRTAPTDDPFYDQKYFTDFGIGSGKGHNYKNIYFTIKLGVSYQMTADSFFIFGYKLFFIPDFSDRLARLSILNFGAIDNDDNNRYSLLFKGNTFVNHGLELGFKFEIN